MQVKRGRRENNVYKSMKIIIFFTPRSHVLQNLFATSEKITDGIPCINDLTLSYSGTISITRSGITCQKWSEQYPHEHPFTQDSMFPADSDVSGANNYCRDPDGEGMPWCYTTLPTKRWEYCGILICKYSGLKQSHNVRNSKNDNVI